MEKLAAQDIYLIGDIFNFWVGSGQENSYKTLLDCFERLSRNGSRISFLHGNRDFLVDQLPGMHVIGRKTVMQMNGRKIHMEHGDLLLNRDGKYFAYRRFCDARSIRDAFSLLPFAFKITVARLFRFISKRTTGYYMWPQKEIIKKATSIISENDADTVVLGHIHQPQRIEFEYAKKKREVIILGDWQGNFAFARLDGDKVRLEYYRRK